jgi:hypothetical protein
MHAWQHIRKISLLDMQHIYRRCCVYHIQIIAWHYAEVARMVDEFMFVCVHTVERTYTAAAGWQETTF